ncbi:MAG: 3D domain-containing protein, partial [Cyclobacteriaceae bacterium]
KEDTVYLASYAGRSKYKQFDCRECESYRNYPGYNLTGKVRWEISEGRVTGSTGLNLVPLKSIAVDPTVIPYKSVIFIPEAIGTTYFNEEGVLVQHDGYFLAADTGSLIKGHHIDVYLGTGKTNPFAFVKSDEGQPFQAFVVKDEVMRERLLEMHR